MFCPQCGNEIGDQTTSTSEVAPTQPLSAVTPLPPTQPLSAVTPAPNVATEKEDSVRGRVKKIRKVSSVMIDQAAYDPSLRFLLVAAALFVLFLVLLILSKVLG